MRISIQKDLVIKSESVNDIEILGYVSYKFVFED
jgi:hypothetical protein